MLKNTFHHVPGIGIKTEVQIWNSGILGWGEFKEPFYESHRLPPAPEPLILFRPDLDTIERIKRENGLFL
ncbi:MAG: hypothetical protein KKH68_03175 [Proteobacteria bacterium]|nr:hypothetical protein [Pseudomonadota bacterium]